MRLTIKYFAIILLVASLATCLPMQTLEAQQITPTVQPALGGTMRNGNYVMTYTVGQLPAQQIKVNNLILTPGFQQPIKPEPPLVPATQTMCSDTAFTFTFNAQAGKGANKVEWATNSTFTSSHIISSPDSFTVSVDTGATDTIWLRSFNSVEGTKSIAVTTTAIVHAYPKASISPLDTTIKIDDTVLLQAGDGGSYYWPQFGTDSSRQAIVLQTLSEEYLVEVKNIWGCMVEKSAVIDANYQSSHQTIVTSITINGLSTTSGNVIAYACNDTGRITVTVIGAPDSNYTISLALPSGWVPFLGSVMPDTIIPKWDSATGVLTWDTLPSYAADSGTFELSSSVYFDCATRGTQDSLVDTSLGVILTKTSLASLVGVPTNSITVAWPGLKGVTPYSIYANPGAKIIDTFEICGDSGRIYALILQSSGYYDSVQITPEHHSNIHVNLGFDTLEGGYVLSDSTFITLFGTPYMDDTDCFTLKTLDSITALSTCGGVPVTLSAKVLCNSYSGYSGIDTICNSTLYSDTIKVGDDGNKYPLQISMKLFADGNVTNNIYTGGTNITIPGINMCDSTFTIQFTDSNPGKRTGQPPSYDEKILRSLTVYLDPFWIDASNLKVLYATDTTVLSVTNIFGYLTIAFPDSPAVILYDSAKGVIQLTGLKVNYPNIASACNISDVAIDGITQNYTTLCGIDTSTFSFSSYLNSSLSGYQIIDSTYIAGIGDNHNDISLGHDATLTFCWSPYSYGEDPWNFDNDTLPLFHCDSTSYLAQITIPQELFFASDSLIEIADGHVISYHTFDSLGGGIYTANLSPFATGVCLKATLKVTTCPSSFSGGLVEIPCHLIQRCLDTTSSCRAYHDYCFSHTSSALSVHCPGVCDSTGIGTDSLVITNLSTITPSTPAGLTNAYACDTIEFRVTGTGYTNGPPPDSTQEIFLLLTYPNADTSDPIFDISSASAWYSYNGSGEIPINIANIIGPSLGSGDTMWSVTVPITDRAACDSIRTLSGQPFIIDIKMKVRCDLAYKGTGVYSLDFVTGAMEFTTGSHDTLYSCDNSGTGLVILNHQYRDTAYFLPLDSGANICTQTLEIRDQATGGEYDVSEMGTLNRPLITWPTDGSLRVIYDKRYLSVNQLVYSNSQGFTFNGTLESDTICTPYLSYSDPGNLTFGNLQTQVATDSLYDTLKIFGFSDTCNIHFWPEFSKDSATYYYQLLVGFNMAGCSTLVNKAIVILPHQQQDGKDSAECAEGCNQWLIDTFSNISVSPFSLTILKASLSLPTDTFNGSGFVDTLFLGEFANGLNYNNIWFNAEYASSSPQGITMTFPDSATNLVGHWLHASSDSIPFSFTVNTAVSNCADQELKWKVAYVCPAPGANLDTLPAADTVCTAVSEVSQYINIYQPDIELVFNHAQTTGYPNAYTFDNCKGICCTDGKLWTLDITNNSGSNAGYAFEPVLTLAQIQGDAILNIGHIVFKHLHNGLIGDSVVYPVNAPAGIQIFNFSDPVFTPLALDTAHTATQDSVHYLPHGDTISAAIKIFGNALSCGWDAVLQGSVSCYNICGDVSPATVTSAQYASISYFFNLDTCNPVPCSSFCQDTAGMSEVCNPCEASPIIINPTIVEATCGYSNGKVILTVTGGEPGFSSDSDILNPPAYTYVWTPSGSGKQSTNLANGSVVSVTVSDGGCADSMTFLINNSGMTINDSIISVDCGGGNTGGIWLHVTPDSGTYVYHWNTGSSDSVITGLSAGLYTVTITNVHGGTVCADSTIDTIEVSQFTNLTIQIYASDPACNDSNGYLLAYASGGVPPYHYRWNNGDTTSELTGLGQGIYGVTATDANGCEMTKSDTLQGLSSLTSRIKVLQGSPCGPDSIEEMILFDSLPSGVSASYLWSNGSTGSDLDLPPATQGTYSVTATIAGCISTATINVVALGIGRIYINYSCTPMFIIDLFGPDTITSFSPGLPPYTFTFTDSNGAITSIIMEPANDSMSYIAYIPQNLLFDSIHLHIQDSWGCQANENYQLNTDSFLLACCFGYADTTVHMYTADTVFFDTLKTFTDSLIYFGSNTVVIVGDTLTFQNCVVAMGANSQIVIEGGLLNVYGTTIKGCDSMWQGIAFDGAVGIDVDSLNGERSEIDDALLAVNATGGGEKVFLRNSNFYKNEEGLLVIANLEPAIVQHYFDSIGKPVSVGVDISNCHFGMGGYSSMLAGATSIRPQFGIGMEYSDSVLIPNPYFNGKPNTFQGMNEGIDMAGSFTYLFTNYFDSIKQYDSLGCGCAVTAFGYSVFGEWGSGELLVQPATSMPDTSSAITFKDCDVGVQSQYQRVKVCDARMENVTSCVKAMNYDAAVWVDSNYFNHTDYGVYLSNNLGGQQVVANNIFYVNPPDFDVPVPLGYPGEYIYLPATTYAISEYEVSNNVSVSSNIYNNLIYSGRNGILMNNVDSAFIYTNTIHQRDQTPSNGTEAGIYAQNCVDLFVDSNYVDGDTTPSGPIVDTGSLFIGSYIKHGFYFYQSAGEICNNTLGATNTAGQLAFGLLFAGQCMGTDIYNNTFNRSTYAIDLTSSGSTAALGNQGYDSTSINMGQSNANDFNGDGTAGHNFNGGYRTFSSITACDTCPYFPPTFYYTTTGTGGNTQTTDPSQGEENGGVQPLVAIKADSILASNLDPYNCKNIDIPDLTGWKSLMHPEPIVTGRQRLNDWDMIIVHDSAQYYMEPGYAEVGSWLTTEALYNKLHADTALMMGNTEMQGFYYSISNTTIGKMNKYQMGLKALTNSSVMADSFLYRRTLENLKGMLHEISPTNVPEENFVAVNNIYINRLNNPKDTLSAEEIHTLAALAVQCPYVAGDAVYAARALLSQVDPHWYFDDVTLCATSVNESVKKPSPIDSSAIPPLQYVKVFPNPTGGQLNVSFMAKTSGPVKFELINDLGQTVKTVVLPQGANYATFDVSNLANGIYHWSLKDSVRIIASGKESIVR